MPTDDGAPFIADDTRSLVGGLLERALDSAEPDSLVDGGGSDDRDHFARQPRNYDELQRRQAIYVNGGPLTDFVDTRALMTYGTGVTFESTDDTQTDDKGRTPDEWAADTFDTIDEHMITAGIQTYVYGDAWPEVVTDRGGGFSHVGLVDPVTVDPRWNQHGTITELRQVVETGKGRATVEPLDTDAVGHYWFKNSSGGPLGDSLIEQNRDEIRRFASNQDQRANAIRLHGSPHYHIKVGSEGQTIADRLLRRVRNRFRSTDTDEKTNWVTGGDIEVNELDAPGFEGMESITETDIALLASGMGIPLEWTNFGSDGLGEGAPAESRQLKFERQARAEQRRRAQQFREAILVPVLAEYSPFDREVDLRIQFGDVVSDTASTAEWLRDFTSYYSPDEVREKLGDDPAPDDADLGPPEGTPAAESPGEGEGGGLFTTPTDADAPDPLPDDHKHLHTDGGGSGNADGRALLYDEASADALTQEELVWQDVYDKVLWADGDDADDRALFEFDPEEVPQFVIDNLENAIADGALFGQFDTIPDWASGQVGDALLDSLSQRQGWSINSLTERIQGLGVGIDKLDAERIARTETAALVNTARKEGYQDEFAGEAVFKWVGPSNSRTTDACEWLKRQTNPEFGGDPVTLERMEELIAEAPTHDDEMDADIARPGDFLVHPNERHTVVRAVS